MGGVVYLGFLAAKKRKAFYALVSSSLLVFSVSGMSLVQYFFSSFCMLCCSPRSSSACSSLVNVMLVRLACVGRNFVAACLEIGSSFVLIRLWECLLIHI